MKHTNVLHPLYCSVGSATVAVLLFIALNDSLSLSDTNYLNKRNGSNDSDNESRNSADDDNKNNFKISTK